MTLLLGLALASCAPRPLMVALPGARHHDRHRQRVHRRTAWLATFSARPLAHGMVRVDWRTDLEIDTDRFEVEKSTDGATFRLLGTVPPRGAGRYTLADVASPGPVYYRLKIVAADRRCAYSPVLAFRPGQLLTPDGPND